MTDVIGQLREAAGHLQEWRPERLAGFGKLGDDLKRRITVGFAASTVDSGEALPSAAETPRTVADLGGAVTPPSEALGGRVSPRSVQTSSGGPPTGAEDWDSGAGSATAAERAREETIRRNRERMAMLGLFETSRALADTALAKKRAAAAARPSQRGAKRPRPAEPPRRSGRLAQLPAESGGLPDVGGTLVRVGFETVRVAGEAPPSEPLDTPVPLKSDLGDAGDAAFLEALRREGASGDADRLRAKRAAGIRGYGLEERLVCKVARTAIPHLSLLPRSDMVAVAAGDKGGRVSVWVASWESWAPRDEDAETEERIAAGKAYVEEADGVAVFPAHRSYVSGLRFVGSGTGAELLTAAYDGAVRRMDVERGEMALVWGDEERELSAMDAAESGAVFVAEKDGEMGMLDTRTGGVAVQFFQGHERKINSLSVEPRGHLLASGEHDKPGGAGAMASRVYGHLLMWSGARRRVGRKSNVLPCLTAPSAG